ncbi:MAG: ArsR family transcriptional regulator [Rhodocyclaceae bacterium]|nr:ArsR family transcriptional regulator [Rhodocyclaceae bacterium]
MLAALGSTTRLFIFKTLIRAGDPGINVSTLRHRVGMPASTLGHHLSLLVEAGLVAQTRVGRELICTVRFETVRSLGTYLMSECCTETSS